jgi:hypothetical protein
MAMYIGGTVAHGQLGRKSVEQLIDDFSIDGGVFIRLARETMDLVVEHVPVLIKKHKERHPKQQFYDSIRKVINTNVRLLKMAIDVQAARLFYKSNDRENSGPKS